MATLLSPEPQKPSLSATLMSIIVLLPALAGSYGSYRASTADTDAGYKELVKTTVALQEEVLRLHDAQAVLLDRNAMLTDKVELQGHQLVRLLADLQVASEDVEVEMVKSKVTDMWVVQQKDDTSDAGAPDAGAALLPLPAAHIYEPKPPPATLQQAIQAQEKL